MSTTSDFTENGSTRQQFSEEQLELTQRVNGSSDYYEILGVNSSATDSELKKGYRKMALLLHPDKNQAPGATDAFKAVGKAFAVLSDTEKRKQYDMYGADYAGSTLRQRRRHGSNSSSSSFSDDYEEEELFDPQEIFNMFFGGGYPSENVNIYRQGNTYYYSHRNYRQPRVYREQESILSGWFQALPLLIFVLITFLSFFSFNIPQYSFVRTRDYPLQRTSSNLRISYFVKHDFTKDYKPGSASLKNLERNIESEFVDNLRSSCYQERIYKENLKNQAIYFGRQDLLDKAKKTQTPSCERLHKIFGYK